jgi:cytochrome P450
MTIGADASIFDPCTYAGGVPHETFRRLRDEHPVSWQPEPEVLGWPAGPGFWAVTRYDDVKAVSKSPATFSSWLGATQIRDPDPADLPFIRRMMLNMDPPDHNRLRKIVSKAFTRRYVECFGDTVRWRARSLVDGVIEQGRADLPMQVTDDFPLLNLADILGVPEADRALMLEWTNRIIGYQDPEHGDTPRDRNGQLMNPRSPEALQDMFDYAERLAADKRAQPADDLMTAMVQAKINGRGLTGPELEMFFFLLAVAGNDTVRSAVPGGMLAFAEHPDQRRRLVDDPELLPTAIDEVLRFVTPVHTFRRTATQDTELGGEHIHAGDKVVVFYCSANRDERTFADPDTFDIARTPNDHLSFGDGPHVCLGSHFATLQLHAFFREALWRMHDLQLDGPVERLTSNFINGIKHLPVRFTPGPRSEAGQSLMAAG